MKIAVVIGVVGLLLTVGGAGIGFNRNSINRVEDSVCRKLERVEDKIDKQSVDIRDLAVAIGKLEEKIHK